ncbi:ankyrin-2-like [Hoplias malabaricus]|uniref:ankyrin-2-like n=1 Tax=Hoplias malabaricus TaxID=27720 RepID=UPI003462988F
MCVQELDVDQHGYAGTEGLFPTEIQRGSQAELEETYLPEIEQGLIGHENMMKEFISTEAQKELEETYLQEIDSQLEYKGSMNLLPSTEFQEYNQTELEGTSLKHQEDLHSYEGTIQLTHTKIKNAQTDTEETCIQEMDEEDKEGHEAGIKEIQEQIQTVLKARFEDLDYDIVVSEAGEIKQIKGTTEASKDFKISRSEEFLKMQQKPYHDIQPTRPCLLDTAQHVTVSSPKSAYQSDSLETSSVKECFSSQKSPDSIDPSPSKDFQHPDFLESCPTEPTHGSQSLDQTCHSSEDLQICQFTSDLPANIESEKRSEITFQKDVEGSPDSKCLSMSLKPYSASSNGGEREEAIESSLEKCIPEEMMFEMAEKIKIFDEIEKEDELRKMFDSSGSALFLVKESVSDDPDKSRTPIGLDASSYSETEETHGFFVPIKPFSSQPIDDDDVEKDDLDMCAISKKQITPEEEMFKIAAKIKVFQEIENNGKKLALTLQDKDELPLSPSDHEQEEAKYQKGSLESSQVPPSPLESEVCNDPELSKLPQELCGQAISENQASEFMENGAEHKDVASIDEPPQIDIDRKEDSHVDLSPLCLIKTAGVGENILVTSENDGESDCVIAEETPHQSDEDRSIERILRDNVLSVSDSAEPQEEQKPGMCIYIEEHREQSEVSVQGSVQGDLVPWNDKLEDDESFCSQSEAEEKKVLALVSESQSTSETATGRTPTEDGTPDPFMFQEGKLFEMTRGGAIDMSKRSMEEEQDAFIFFSLREEEAEEAPSEQMSEESGILSSSQELTTTEEHSLRKVSAEDVYQPQDLEHCSSKTDPGSTRGKDPDSVSPIITMDTATSTVTRSIYSEQDQESSDSSTEEEQHSVIEIPIPTLEMISLPSILGTCFTQSLISTKESSAEAESKKMKSKIPVKSASFEQILGKGDSTEQSQRPKSETDVGFSDLLTTNIEVSSAKPKPTASRLHVPVEQMVFSSPQVLVAYPQQFEDMCKQGSTDEKDFAKGFLDSEGDSRPLPGVRPFSVGEDVFETRPNWEDCVETQMQRISDSSSPDQSYKD